MRKEKKPEKRSSGSSAGRECATTTTRKSKESKFEEEGSLKGEFLDSGFFFCYYFHAYFSEPRWK